MDTVTHTLLGLALTSLRRPGKAAGEAATARAVAWCSALAANLPDLDVLLIPGGSLNHIKYHRGITHSLPVAVAFAAALTLLARWRWRRAESRAVFGWSLLAVLVGHLAADLITSFGTRVLLPWDNTYYALDWVNLLEPLILLPLVAGTLAARLRPDRARRWLGAALALSLAAVAYRGAAHEVLLRHVRNTYSREAAVISASLQPTYWSLTRYEYVVETPGVFRLGAIRVGGPPVEYAVYFKPIQGDPVVEAAVADPALRPILRFARHPLLTYRPTGSGYEVMITDFRGGFAFYFHTLISGLASGGKLPVQQGPTNGAPAGLP